MAYRLHKETPQLRIKIEEPNGQADISPETSGRHSFMEWLTTPSNSSQVWAVWAAASHSLRLDRKPLGMGNEGEHHHTHLRKQRMKYGEVDHL